ncbi:uncharacterized protein [Cherax quadricarinatus]|uniref:uncharacterized protein n=1 Tax=Cherax quadricarinatus TaxID=27406 RepID=UPI00387E7027
MIQLNAVCVVVVCILSTASPTLNNPRAPELNLDPVYADFTSFGKGNTLVESALEAKMGGNEPAESSAKTLGLLSGSGSFESRSDTGLDLPKGSSAGTSEYGGINKGFNGGFVGSSNVRSAENLGSSAFTNLRGQHMGSGVIRGRSSAGSHR